MNKTNALLRNSLANGNLEGGGGGRRTSFVDCGAELWAQRDDLLPDLVHPSLAGYEAWARCLAPALLQLIAGTR